METLVPYRAPELLLCLVNEQYAYAVNCSCPNSFRLLTRTQHDILSAINNQDNLHRMADRLLVPCETLYKFFLLLGKGEIVRFDNYFSQPQKPENPTSLNFWIHTTNACNLGCSYCYISTLNTGGGMQEAVRQQLTHKLVEAVRLRSIRHIKLRLAGGEPLTQFNAWKTFIPETREVLAAEGCKLEVAFLTNLTLLNEEIIEFSKQHHISYGVSLDGLADTHDTTRMFRSGTGSFEIVSKNLQRLIAAGITVSVNTVVSKFNLKDLPELTRYLIALDIRFRYAVVKGEQVDAVGLDQSLSASYYIMEEAIEEGWPFSSRYQFCDLKPNELGFQTCASGFSGGAIYVDGTFKYCHVNFGEEANQSRTIFDDGFDLVAMIESSEHLEEHRSADCRKCRYRSVCTSGCPVYRVDSKDPQCSLYHRFIPMYYHLQAKERLKLLRKAEIMQV